MERADAAKAIASPESNVERQRAAGAGECVVGPGQAAVAGRIEAGKIAEATELHGSRSARAKSSTVSAPRPAPAKTKTSRAAAAFEHIVAPVADQAIPP